MTGSSDLDYSAPATLIELLRERARGQPDRTAYHFLRNGEEEREQITYAELDKRARNIAGALQERLAPSDRVLLLHPPGLAFAEAFFGCLYAGAIAVPAYPPRAKRRDGRIDLLAADSGASLALTTSAVLQEITQEGGATASTSLEWLATDGPTDDGAPWREPAVVPDGVAYLQYTSGSTSRPKGVMVTHANVLHNCACVQQASNTSPDSVSVSWLPTFHDMGLLDGLVQPLFSGFLGVLMPPGAFLRRPIRWLRAISRYGATHAGGPNIGYDLCVSKTTADAREGLDLRTWTTAYNGAEPIRRPTLEAFVRTYADYGFRADSLRPVYGLAEATLIVSGGPKSTHPTFLSANAVSLEQGRVAVSTDGLPARELVGCGRAMKGIRVVIADPKARTRCAPDHIGEIWVSGPSVTAGYWNRPSETKKTYGAHLADSGDGPFLRTGDLGFVKDEELFITGRLKHLIIIRGRNIYPQDIELTVEGSHKALRPHCGVALSVDVAGEERLVVVHELRRSAVRESDFDGTIKAIRAAIFEAHEVQAHEIVLIRPGTLPKTSSGKLARTACRERYLAQELELLASSGPLEGGLAASASRDTSEAFPQQTIRCELEIGNWIANELARKFLLDVTMIDPTARFTDYGLDSLSAMEVMENLQEWLGRQLEETVLWDYPTPKSLAAYLAGQEAGAPESEQDDEEPHTDSGPSEKE